MKKIFIVLLIAVLVFNLGACTVKEPEVEINEEEISEGVTDSNSEFAVDIFKELNGKDLENNVFISPFSISTALTMTYNGAVGQTKEEMEEALRYRNIDIKEVNNTYKNLIPYLSNVDKDVEIDISNSIWYREGEGIKEEFLSTNTDVFDAMVEGVDFTDPETVDTINGWIEESTKGKIEKMLDAPLPGDVVMYLINAVYFKGTWKYEFDEDDTYDGLFTDINENEQEVKMMSIQTDSLYGEGEDYKTVKLPYGNEKVSMYFVLPTEGTINDLIDTLNKEKLDEIKNSVAGQEDFLIQIPRFKLEYGIKEISESLKNMGMPAAFSPEADFSNIREGLFINRVLHKAVVEVNEQGSEAAAATVVEMVESAMPEEKNFIADRPFVFFIAEEDTGTVLFLGKYATVE
ncbi:MAG: serpin family protein [Bacillota bacterium]|nr:serpin family protein [Bacillota bacterium]